MLGFCEMSSFNVKGSYAFHKNNAKAFTVYFIFYFCFVLIVVSFRLKIKYISNKSNCRTKNLFLNSRFSQVCLLIFPAFLDQLSALRNIFGQVFFEVFNFER